MLKVFIRADKAKVDKINLTSLDAITEEIIIQINQFCKQSKKFLIVIDNAEELIENSE